MLQQNSLLKTPSTQSVYGGDYTRRWRVETQWTEKTHSHNTRTKQTGAKTAPQRIHEDVSGEKNGGMF
jgi:hypothetical protein